MSVFSGNYIAYIYAVTYVVPSSDVLTGVFFPDTTIQSNLIRYHEDCETWEHLQIPSKFINGTLNMSFQRTCADVLESGVFEYPIEPEVLNDFEAFYNSPSLTGYKDVSMAKILTVNGRPHLGESLGDYVAYLPLLGVWGWLFTRRNDVLSTLRELRFTREIGFTKDNFLKDKLYSFLSLMTINSNHANICALPGGMTYSDYSNLW